MAVSIDVAYYVTYCNNIQPAFLINTTSFRTIAIVWHCVILFGNGHLVAQTWSVGWKGSPQTCWSFEDQAESWLKRTMKVLAQLPNVEQNMQQKHVPHVLRATNRCQDLLA